jgi:uncharacterized protein YecE (DUF72 family)
MPRSDVCAAEPTFAVGCCGFIGPRDEYFAHLSLVEVQETFFAPVRAATLRRWRSEAEDDFCFSIRAWQVITHEPPRGGYPRLPADAELDLRECGLLRPTATVLRAYERTAEAARELDACAIVFETPVNFTPTAANRENMKAFFSTIDRGDALLVWHPQGVWSDGEVRRICADLDLVPATTLVAPDEPPAAARYYRLKAPRYSEDELERLADEMLETEVALCVFGNGSAFADAQRLQALLSGEA